MTEKILQMIDMRRSYKNSNSAMYKTMDKLIRNEAKNVNE